MKNILTVIYCFFHALIVVTLAIIILYSGCSLWYKVITVVYTLPFFAMAPVITASYFDMIKLIKKKDKK